MTTMRSTSFVAAGGAAGAAVRWGVGQTITTPGAGFPWPTFVVNVIGCALIGLAVRRLDRGTDVWYGLVTGVLGGLTTFSAFADETRALLAHGQGLTAAVYVGASVIVGVVALELARAERDVTP